jgi:hypothetical protein
MFPNVPRRLQAGDVSYRNQRHWGNYDRSEQRGDECPEICDIKKRRPRNPARLVDTLASGPQTAWHSFCRVARDLDHSEAGAANLVSVYKTAHSKHVVPPQNNLNKQSPAATNS